MAAAPKRPSHREERKRILAAIVQVAGGKLEGKTLLFKAYWVAHLYFWRQHNGTLTRDHGVVHMPNGPGIDGHVSLLAEMQRDGLVSVQTRKVGKGSQNVYLSRKHVKVSEDEIDSILQALRMLRNASSNELSEFSHELSRSWKAGAKGKPLDIYLDTLDEKLVKQTDRRIAAAEAMLKNAFG